MKKIYLRNGTSLALYWNSKTTSAGPKQAPLSDATEVRSHMFLQGFSV